MGGGKIRDEAKEFYLKEDIEEGRQKTFDNFKNEKENICQNCGKEIDTIIIIVAKTIKACSPECAGKLLDKLKK